VGAAFVAALGESVAGGVTAATFHSVCARLLREHAGVFGRVRAHLGYGVRNTVRIAVAILRVVEQVFR